MNSTIGQRLKSIRGSRTQAEFSRQYSIHKNTLARYERDERAPDAELLLELANDGYDVNWILIGKGAEKIAEPAASYDEINWEQLEEVIKGIEMIIAHKKRTMRPDRKAELIKLLYQYYTGHSNREGLSGADRKIVMDIIESALTAGTEYGDQKS